MENFRRKATEMFFHSMSNRANTSVLFIIEADEMVETLTYLMFEMFVAPGNQFPLCFPTCDFLCFSILNK